MPYGVSALTKGLGISSQKRPSSAKRLAIHHLEGELPDMEGEIAVAYGDDMLAPARVMGEQSKELEERLVIVGGVFESALVYHRKRCNQSQLFHH